MTKEQIAVAESISDRIRSTDRAMRDFIGKTGIVSTKNHLEMLSYCEHKLNSSLADIVALKKNLVKESEEDRIANKNW